MEIAVLQQSKLKRFGCVLRKNENGWNSVWIMKCKMLNVDAG